MNEITVTEFVKFRLPETTSQEMLLARADALINGFLKSQDGFRDGELVKDVQENIWCFILRYGNMDQVKAITAALRNCKEFDDFRNVIVPGSIEVSFNLRVNAWEYSSRFAG